MPREILRDPVYACTSCNKKYPLWDDALRCEKRGVKPHRFHHGQVARFAGPNADPDGHLVVVHKAWSKGETIAPHEEPFFYDATINCTKFIGAGGVARDSFCIKSLSEVKHEAAQCPLCDSGNVTTRTAEYNVDHSPTLNFTLADVAHTKCMDCKTVYFTESQLQAMLGKAVTAMSAAPATSV